MDDVLAIFFIFLLFPWLYFSCVTQSNYGSRLEIWGKCSRVTLLRQKQKMRNASWACFGRTSHGEGVFPNQVLWPRLWASSISTRTRGFVVRLQWGFPIGLALSPFQSPPWSGGLFQSAFQAWLHFGSLLQDTILLVQVLSTDGATQPGPEMNNSW